MIEAPGDTAALVLLALAGGHVLERGEVVVAPELARAESAFTGAFRLDRLDDLDGDDVDELLVGRPGTDPGADLPAAVGCCGSGGLGRARSSAKASLANDRVDPREGGSLKSRDWLPDRPTAGTLRPVASRPS